jgi:hypothetical protein
VTVLNEPLKVYPYTSSIETERKWKIASYPSNEFTLLCRSYTTTRSGLSADEKISASTAYFNLIISGSPIPKMTVKITKQDADKYDRTKKGPAGEF